MSANKYFVLSNAKKISQNLSSKDQIKDNSLDPLFSTLRVLNFKDLNRNDATMLVESLDFPLTHVEKTSNFKQQTSKIIERLHSENDSFIKDFHFAAKKTDEHSFSNLLAEASMQYYLKNTNEKPKLSSPKFRP